MLDFPAPKTMAKALRGALAERGHALTHGQCLDLVARQLGYPNWNVLAPISDGAGGLPDLVVPEGWHANGKSKHLYRTGLAPDVPGAAIVEALPSVDIPSDSFAGLMQSLDAVAYLGKRLKLSAQLKSVGAGQGTIWMRVDAKEGGRPTAFDNLEHRQVDGPIEGDTDWVERSIVLDVSRKAESIHFGFFMHAPGKVFARRFSLETVEKDVPVTRGRFYPGGPSNLGFGAS